jgi:hypothetical protein
MDNISFNTCWTLPEYDRVNQTSFIWSGRRSIINVNNLKSMTYDWDLDVNKVNVIL